MVGLHGGELRGEVSDLGAQAGGLGLLLGRARILQLVGLLQPRLQFGDRLLVGLVLLGQELIAGGEFRELPLELVRAGSLGVELREGFRLAAQAGSQVVLRGSGLGQLGRQLLVGALQARGRIGRGLGGVAELLDLDAQVGERLRIRPGGVRKAMILRDEGVDLGLE